MNIAVILAAGDSRRFGSDVHKQYLKLNGKEVLYYTYTELAKCENIDKVLVVIDEEEYNTGYIANKYHIEMIKGGQSRNDSIQNALDYVKAMYPCEKIVFHDSVRPFFKAQTFSYYIDELSNFDAIVTVADIIDTLSKTDYTYCDRQSYILVQAPEAFRFDVLTKYFDVEKEYGALVNFLPKTCRIKSVKENVFNFKITYPQDLFLAEQFAKVNFHSTKKTNSEINYSVVQNVLLFGSSGGIGQAVKERLEEHSISYMAPGHAELDLEHVTAQHIQDYCGDFVPSIIINAAAAYEDDDKGLSATFDKIFSVNLKANLVLIEYAQMLGTTVNLVLLSSSSSTRGRENLTNYSAAKAALNSVVESQAARLLKQDIRLNAVIPEKVNTALIEKLHKTKISSRELLDVDEVMDAIFYYATCTLGGELSHVRKGL